MYKKNLRKSTRKKQLPKCLCKINAYSTVDFHFFFCVGERWLLYCLDWVACSPGAGRVTESSSDLRRAVGVAVNVEGGFFEGEKGLSDSIIGLARASSLLLDPRDFTFR